MSSVTLSKKQMEFVESVERYTLFCGGLGSGKCLKKGTLVKTPTGAKPIEELEIGEEIYGYNDDGTVSLTKVLDVIDQGVKEVVDLVRYNQVVATCTEEHRWLADYKGKRKVKRINELQDGKHGIVKLSHQIPCGTKQVDSAYAIGALLGDGCSTCSGIMISSKDERVVKKATESLGLGLGYTPRKAYNYSWRIKTGRSRQSIPFYDEWCSDRLAHEKIADIKEIRTWTRESQLEFLSGLIDTDGSVYIANGYAPRLVLQLGMQARSVVETAQLLLLDLFEVQVDIKEDKRAKYKNGSVWYLKISNNHEVKKILRELKTVVSSKQYKPEYDSFREGKFKGSVYFNRTNRRQEQCYDLMVSNDTQLYLLANGMVTHNTFSGAVWAAMMALKYQNTNGIITANTHGQLTKATLVSFFNILESLGIEYTYRRNSNEIDVFNCRIYAMSMENYNVLRGIEAGWAWSDECAFYTKESFDVLMGRIRDKKGPCQWKGTTTPNGFNWLYTAFVEQPLPSARLVTSKTTDNLVNLSESYVETLLSQYDSNLMRQELEGEFINLTSGKVYYGFDRRKNVGPVSESNNIIHLGLDFNVDPLCGTFGFYRDGKIYISEELYQRDSNTFKASKEVIARYPNQRMQVVCDQTGDRRKTSAAKTDHQILRDAGTDVLRFINPPEKDRHNNLNRLFEKGLIVIDPKCKMLIGDLEKITHENKDEMLGHISTALGYLAWYFLPHKKPRREASVSQY